MSCVVAGEIRACNCAEGSLFGLFHEQVEWVVALDEEAGPVVAMEWRVEVESVVVGRSSGQVSNGPRLNCTGIAPESADSNPWTSSGGGGE